MSRFSLAGTATVAALVLSAPAGEPTARAVTLIHIGDVHGRLVARPNLRRDGTGEPEGGLARVATVVRRIRGANAGRTLLVNTGDALHGSAEALFTRGGAVIDVMNALGIDASVPGNWDFVYATARFLETFAGAGGAPPLAPWNALAANLRYSTLAEDPTTPYPARAGQPVLPSYVVRSVGGIRVGIIGLTTRRGVQGAGAGVTKGLTFTSGEDELPALLARLREVERVDLVVLASELELANNIRLAESNPGIDVILSSDMHEVTSQPIVTRTGTLIAEEGQDGTSVGELRLEVGRAGVTSWSWTRHRVTARIEEDPVVSRIVAAARAPLVQGPRFVADALVNPINGTRLRRPLDAVVGSTAVPLHRSGFTDDDTPGVVEGTSHEFLTDAMRAVANADIAVLRGFRYGTHVPPGPVTMGDLYAFLPIGAQVARAYPVYGPELKEFIERALRGVFESDPRAWTGGWTPAFSGLTFDLDVYQPTGYRVSNLRVDGAPLDLSGRTAYSVAGLWFASDPGSVYGCASCFTSRAAVTVVTDDMGARLDATEVVVRYLETLPGRTAAPRPGRVRLVRALPSPRYGFPVIQPLPTVVEGRRTSER